MTQPKEKGKPVNKEYKCKICNVNLMEEPSDDPPVSEFCSNRCHILYLEAVVIKKLEEAIKDHIVRYHGS